MADDIETPEPDLTPKQQQYAQIAREVGREIAAAVKESLKQGERSSFTQRVAQLPAQFRSYGMEVPPAVGAAAAVAGGGKSQEPPKDVPNAGAVHIEPGKGQKDVSFGGKAAIAMTAHQERMAAYGLEVPGWMSSATSAAKVLSNVSGDTHTFGARLRERERFRDHESVAAHVAARVPSSDLSPGVSSAKPEIQPSSWPDRVPSPQQTRHDRDTKSDGPRQAAAMAGPSLQPGISRSSPTTGAPGGMDALLRAVEVLTKAMEELTKAMREGDEDETETAENVSRKSGDNDTVLSAGPSMTRVLPSIVSGRPRSNRPQPPSLAGKTEMM